MAGKRDNPAYGQLLAYVPRSLIVKFKTFCAANELEQSVVIEDLLAKWVAEQEQQKKE